MTFLNATVYMAGLSRTVKVGIFNDDKKSDLFARYVYKLDTGVEGAILNRLLRLVNDEDCDSGIMIRVEMEPFGQYGLTYEYGEIDNVMDLCDKMSEISMVVIKKSRRNDD